jgi:uncharacterized membrane protein
MTPFALIFTLACIGISETMYLIRKRLAREQPACPIGGGCHAVLESKYGKLFFIPNDVLGLAAYVIIALMASLLVIGSERQVIISQLLNVLITIASLMSLFFVYLQWRVIKAWCFWCVMSACTIWLMGITAVTNL